MFDKNVFAEGVGLLTGNYGRELDGPVAREWYAQLSRYLDDQQFIAAVRRCIAEETYWPNAATILEKAGVSPQQRSEGALRMVNDALSEHGGFRFLPAGISQSWDSTTWAAIKDVGGLAAITNCTEERWPAMQRRFQRAYEAALAPRPQLPAVDPRVKQLAAGIGNGGRDNALPPGDR